MITTQERYLGALYGLACGDAVGTTVEFKPRGSFAPVTGMTGGGPFDLKPGQWTDDTSMALCLAESLVTKQCFDPEDQMGRYLNWWQWGYMSATGSCFDIGITVREALRRFQQSGQAYSGSSDPMTAGNGSLMRLAPVVLFAHPDLATIHRLSAESSRTTHGAAEAIECCQLFAAMISAALAGNAKNDLLSALAFTPVQPKVAAIATGTFIAKTAGEIRGNGYCVDSLEAALWCFFNTDSFEAAVLCAANLGEDADTTAAITGQIAGAFYGANAVPAEWLANLSLREDIEHFADKLYLLSHSTSN